MSSPEHSPNEQTDDTAKAENGKDRDQSSIKFPYMDLAEAISIAKGIHELGGSCGSDQLAAHLDQSPKSSGFRIRQTTAKMFELMKYEGGSRVALTDLGVKICDPQQEARAKVDAFLSIELYRAVYEKYKGASLPTESGLEAAIVSLGVVPKQKDRARQVLQRSAKQAGFFNYGNDRLVLPNIKASAAPPADPPHQDQEPKKEKDEDDERAKKKQPHHPFIEGLLKTLPSPETEWPMESRKKWLQAAATVFELMYEDSDNNGSLKIEVQKDSAK